MILENIRSVAKPLIEREHAQLNELYWTLKAQAHESLNTLYQVLKERGAFLVKLFGQDARHAEGAFFVNLVFSLAPKDQFLILKVPVRGHELHFPSITPTFHGANWMEREVQDLFGLKAIGHPNPRRWALHGNWPEGLYPLRKDFPLDADVPWADGDFELREVEGEGVFEIPVGPVHAGVIEPGHFRFSVAGEPIVNLVARLFYAHKGTEKRAEGLTPERVLLLLERVSGDATFAHATAFCQSVERMCAVEIPERAKALRVVLLELERLHNHLGDLGALANDVAFGISYARATALRERLLGLNERWTGSRLLRSAAALGGVRMDASDRVRKDIELTVVQVNEELKKLWELLVGSASVMDRFETTGRLSPESARDLGILGLAGRASGVKRDARRDHPHAAYGRLDFDVPVLLEGDVLARARLRTLEADESTKLILQALQDLPAGPTQTALPLPVRDACALGYVESWRGEAYCWVKTDAQGRIERCKVTDPSTHNWPALLFAVQDNIVPDFPVINKSFSLSYSGNDR